MCNECLDGQQAGMKFQVCDSVEGTCQDCIGSVQHPQQNAWSTIECNSLQGDTIEVSGSITIDICEMIVKGERKGYTYNMYTISALNEGYQMLNEQPIEID